jgi:hypothetical protein
MSQLAVYFDKRYVTGLLEMGLYEFADNTIRAYYLDGSPSQ